MAANMCMARIWPKVYFECVLVEYMIETEKAWNERVREKKKILWF